MEPSEQDLQERRLSLRYGLLNGLFLGLGLALGVWTSDAIFLGLSHVRLVYPSMIAGLLALVLLGGLAGWLAAWAAKAWASALIWLGAGALMVRVIGMVPYAGRTLTIWLADRRAWGLPIYPYGEAAGVGVWLAGFFILLVLAFLGLLQPYRLEGVISETDDRGRLGARGWFLILLPVLLLVGVGLVADSMVNKPLRVAPQLVSEAITTGRTYEGDLFALSLETGVNYGAIAGVREQMSDEYELSIGSVDLSVNDTIMVVADFDNGAWINCRVVAEQLSFCSDASLPYMQGLPAVLATGELPEDCPYCKFSVSDEWRGWLRDQQASSMGTPRISRLAQWGSYVLVQAAWEDNGHAIECLFEGLSPVRLNRCWEVNSQE
ncbi:MAG: hypothetical protein PVH95_08175 [Anaerolineae bacterium]|jgi:hypothetical protein